MKLGILTYFFGFAVFDREESCEERRKDCQDEANKR